MISLIVWAILGFWLGWISKEQRRLHRAMKQQADLNDSVLLLLSEMTIAEHDGTLVKAIDRLEIRVPGDAPHLRRRSLRP